MTMAIIIVITLLITAYFYLKCNVLSSLSTLILIILASFITLTFYEVLADLFVSRGYGAQWPQTGCYVLAFVLSFALLRALSDLLMGGVKIDLGNPIKMSTAIICGLISGLLVCGNLLIALGLSPLQHKMLHSRFNPEQKISLNNAKGSFLNTDGLVAGLYGLASKGALSSKKSFAVLHADFLDQIYLNRLKTKDGVLTITSKKALVLPTGNSKKPVRTREIEDIGTVTVVRMGLMAKDIQDGGAGNASKGGQIEFFPGQVRMVCKTKDDFNASRHPFSTGSGEAIYPIGIMNGDRFIEIDLGQVMPPPDKKVVKSKPLWFDMVFKVPQGSRGVLLQFKQNAVIELPAPVASTEEIEDILDGKIVQEEEEPAEN